MGMGAPEPAQLCHQLRNGVGGQGHLGRQVFAGKPPAIRELSRPYSRKPGSRRVKFVSSVRMTIFMLLHHDFDDIPVGSLHLDQLADHALFH